MRRAILSRAALVPKELLVPVCQRLTFVLFAMCSTAFGIRLYSMWKTGHAHPGLLVNGTHFFLDIGAGNNGFQGFSHTRKLEENGWRGVCADPFPDSGRKCTALSMPVTALTGQPVHIADCRGRSNPSIVELSTATADCPKVARSGVGILDVLKVSRAPPVIDYVSLDVEGLELDILKHFPFDQFCARSWSVTHRNDQGRVSLDVQNLLASQGCRVKEAGPSYWARCHCSAMSSSLLTTDATTEIAAAAQDASVMRKEAPVHTKKSKKAKKMASLEPFATMPADRHLSDDASIMGDIASGVGGTLLASPLSR